MSRGSELIPLALPRGLATTAAKVPAASRKASAALIPLCAHFQTTAFWVQERQYEPEPYCSDRRNPDRLI